MRGFVRSAAYVRVRAVIGIACVVLGAGIIGRTLPAIGFVREAVTPVVLGAALIGLGIMRIREYLRAKGMGLL